LGKDQWASLICLFTKPIHQFLKGIGLVIGCSTFPTWNTVPGLYANLMTGNVCIVKPHPKAIYPIAIFIEALSNRYDSRRGKSS